MKSNRSTRIFVLMLSLAAAVFTTGCNTVKGAGQDIQAGGAAIEKAAE